MPNYYTHQLIKCRGRGAIQIKNLGGISLTIVLNNTEPINTDGDGVLLGYDDVVKLIETLTEMKKGI